MAERSSKTKNADTGAPAAGGAQLEQQVVAFAEQLGRVVGTVQARAEGWLDPQNLNEQMTRVRDGAASLLQQLSTATEARAKPTAAGRRGNRVSPTRTSASGVATPAGRSGGVVDAPGKKHRKPTPNEPLRASAAYKGRLSSMKTVNANRKRGRG